MGSHGYLGLRVYHDAPRENPRTMGEVGLWASWLSGDKGKTRLEVSSLEYRPVGIVLCAISFSSFGLKITEVGSRNRGD